MESILCKLMGHRWKAAPWCNGNTRCCVRCGVVERDGVIFKRYFREYVRNARLGTADIGYDLVLARSYSEARELNIPLDIYGYSNRFVTIGEVHPKHILLPDEDVMIAFRFPFKYE